MTSRSLATSVTVRAIGRERDVQPIRLFESLGIDRDDGIDAGALLVVRVDTIQIELDQLVYGEAPGFVGVVNILYRRFCKMEGFCLALALAGNKKFQIPIAYYTA
jgi:hypothetical protein